MSRKEEKATAIQIPKYHETSTDKIKVISAKTSSHSAIRTAKKQTKTDINNFELQCIDRRKARLTRQIKKCETELTKLEAITCPCVKHINCISNLTSEIAGLKQQRRKLELTRLRLQQQNDESDTDDSDETADIVARKI